MSGYLNTCAAIIMHKEVSISEADSTLKQKKLGYENISGWRSWRRGIVSKSHNEEPDTESGNIIGGRLNARLTNVENKRCCSKPFIYHLVTTCSNCLGNLRAGMYLLYCNSSNGYAATVLRIVKE